MSTQVECAQRYVPTVPLPGDVFARAGTIFGAMDEDGQEDDEDDDLFLKLPRDSEEEEGQLPITLNRDSALEDDRLPLTLPKSSESSLEVFLSSDQVAQNSVLTNILSKFSELDADGSGAITMDELASHWLSAATEVCKRPLSDSEKELIGGSVQRAFDVMDVEQDGKINKHEWLHTALLDMHPPGPVATDIITQKLRESDTPDIVATLVYTWLSADEMVCGIVTRQMLSINPCGDAELLDVMNSTGSDSITYAEFVANVLRLTFRPVELYYYDLSKSFASVLSPILLGQYEDGIWHTSVGVFGQDLQRVKVSCRNVSITPKIRTTGSGEDDALGRTTASLVRLAVLIATVPTIRIAAMSIMRLTTIYSNMKSGCYG
eukprot:s3554_g5.t1